MPDERVAEAAQLVQARRQPDGRWSLGAPLPGAVPVEMEAPGAASRWITLRAMRVLAWCHGRPPQQFPHANRDLSAAQ